MSVERTRVKSSNVWSHGHDPVAQELHVEYSRIDPQTKEPGPSGQTFVYPCTAEEYGNLCAADSAGSHISKTFKGRVTRKRS